MTEIDTDIYNDCTKLLPKHWINVLLTKREQPQHLDGWCCKVNETLLSNTDNQQLIKNDIAIMYDNTGVRIVALTITFLVFIILTMVPDIPFLVHPFSAVALILLWISIFLHTGIIRTRHAHANSLLRELITITKKTNNKQRD